MIRPGGGFPTDKASLRTPIAHDADEVVRLAASAPSLDHLDDPGFVPDLPHPGCSCPKHGGAAE